MTTTTDLEAPPALALSIQMQTYAQGYIDARKRAGEAWLSMGMFLSKARAEAKHGEWGVFLEATNTNEDWAKRLIAIYAQSEHDRRFADAMRTNFLSVATGYELISASPVIQDRLLSGDTPPTVQQIRDEKRMAKSAPAPTLDAAPFWRSMSLNHPTAHLWTKIGMNEHRTACGMIASRAPSGSTEAGHCSSCVRATWPQNQSAPTEPNSSTDRTIPTDLAGWHWMSSAPTQFQLTNGDYQTRVYDHPHHAIVGARNYLESQRPLPAAPDLADILLRLDAHGYAKSGMRQKGMTTFYSFRDYRSTLDDGQAGELELAEGELPLWLAELDTSASYAQAKQEKYLAARERAEKLGYDLRRDGQYFTLSITGMQAPAMRGTLDAQIRAIDGYEKSAAKQPTDSQASERIAHITKEREDQSLLSTAKANIAIGNIGDARRLLGQIQVSTWERDQLLRTLNVVVARRFLADQRERLTRFSPTAMVSQTTWKQALDHIQALLEAAE